MNTKIISAIAFKLFAIYIIVSGVLALPTILGGFLSAKSMFNFNGGIIGPLIISATTIIIAIIAFTILWKLGNGVIDKTPDVSDAHYNTNELEKMFFKLLGIYFIVISLADIPNIVIHTWAKSTTAAEITIIDYSSYISLLITLLIGFSLIKAGKAETANER